MPIRISGCAFEQRVDTRERPVQQRDQIIFEIDLQSYVLVVLAAACFERLPDLISRSVNVPDLSNGQDSNLQFSQRPVLSVLPFRMELLPYL